MKVHELRALDAARQFVEQGLWLQRVVHPSATAIRPALEWSLQLAAGGQPLPPVGFVADVGHLLLGGDRENRSHRDAAGVPGVPAGLIRTYEDLLLGKLFADRSIERAADAVRRYRGRDRARGVAFVVNQLRERAGFDGVLLSPAVLKGMLEAPADEIMARGWNSLGRGAMPLLTELYQDITIAARRMADALGPEDVFELEHGTALADLGQRVALRQVLQTASALEAELPKYKPRPRPSPREVPTQVRDEDVYPVGGFASISTRGTIESLLHSQLAFMEPATEPRPDLFDIKFVRDELLYYSRDENQFLRRRRNFVIALLPDLTRARFKDVELPTQRIVLVLALLVVLTRKLSEWLSADALAFDFVFVADGETQPLAQEEALLAMVFREAIANGTVRLNRVANASAAEQVMAERSRRGQCRGLVVSSDNMSVEAEKLIVDSPHPRFVSDDLRAAPAVGDMEAWQTALSTMLAAWV